MSLIHTILNIPETFSFCLVYQDAVKVKIVMSIRVNDHTNVFWMWKT